jgi:hypothetical protein
MTQREKVKHLISDLSGRGVNPFTTVPPLWRLAWALGFKLTPPHFMGPRALAVFVGVSFGLIGALLIWYFSDGERPWASALWAVILGPLFGDRMAKYYRVEARRLDLPPWEMYPSA